MQPADPHAGRVHVTAFVGAQGPFLSVLCKQRYLVEFRQGRLLDQGLAELSPDLEYCQAPNRIGRSVKKGRDLWPDKELIDLLLTADAVALDERPITSLPVEIAFEEQRASALVFGDRYAYTLGGQLRFSDPEPFVRCPLDDFHAYGGIDPTLMPQTPEQAPRVLGMPVPELFPGANPYNPAGLGYWVRPENFVTGLMLPNVERSDDLLSPDRFFVGRANAWPLAPRPVCWGVQSLWSYPRCLYTNRRPYFMPDATDAPMEGGQAESDIAQIGIGPKLMQQGAQELALSMRDGPLSLSVQGVHPKGALSLYVPAKAPPVEIVAQGQRQALRNKRLAVHLNARSMQLEITWASQCPLDQAPRNLGGLAHLMDRYVVSYAGQKLSERCWPGDRAFLHL